MEIVETDPGDHIASFEDTDVRACMAKLDALIVDALPDRRRDLWEGVFWGGTSQSIIGYGHIVQPRPRGADVDWFLVGLAKQKAGYSLYVNATTEKAYLAHSYADRLGKAKLGAASIGFKKLEDVDLDVLRDLLEHAHRVTEPDPTAQ